MTSSRPLKLLFLLPFAPDLRGSHGGSRSTAAMVDMLSKDHRVCVLGDVRYSSEGIPTSVTVDDIRILRKRSELPQLQDLRAIDITGGLESSDFVVEMRDADAD